MTAMLASRSLDLTRSADAVASSAGSQTHFAVPAPLADSLACRTHDPDLWFSDEPAVLEQAKALCQECPLRSACLSSALARREPWGVWGGEILERGAVISRKRPRGRPRKDLAA